MGNKVLKMTIKREYFNMIRSGVKREEYREIKKYWRDRLFDKNGYPINYDRIEITNGYNTNDPTIVVQFLGAKEGVSKPEWSGGMFSGKCYVISLGKILEERNI